MGYKQVRQSFGFESIAAVYEVPHLYKSVDYYPQGIVVFSSWEASNEVHSYCVPRPRWGHEWFEQPIWSMAYWLDSFASVAMVHVTVDVLTLLRPVESSADKFQCLSSSRVACYLGVMAIVQDLNSQFVIFRDPD